MNQIEEQIINILNKHDEIREHSIKVFLLAYHILGQLPDDYFGKEQERNILVAALFHDLGKGMWPEEWLTAPRRELRESAWMSMQMHPIIGCELLKSLGFDVEPILEIVLQHHEKVGGKGYPDGIEPNREAQFVSACDMLAAATEIRQYRNPLSVDNALNEIKTQMDLKVYQAILKTIR